MKRLSALLSVGILLLAGCNSTQSTAARTPEPEVGSIRFGAADHLGWSLYSSEKAMTAHVQAQELSSH